LQVEQLVAAQVLQALLPIEVGSPSAPLEKAANEENSFLATTSQVGQRAASSA
jgi:hypothetical protein